MYMIWGWTWWILMYLIIWLDRKCFFRPWLRNSNCQSIPSWLRFHAYMIILLLLNLCITKKELTSDNWTCGSMFNNSGQTFLLVSKVWQNSLRFLFESTKFLINSVDYLVLDHTYYYDTLALLRIGHVAVVLVNQFT